MMMMMLNVQLQIGLLTLNQIFRNVLRLLGCIFLTRVTTELVTLRSTAEFLMLLAALRIAAVVLFSCSPCVGLFGEQNVTNHIQADGRHFEGQQTSHYFHRPMLHRHKNTIASTKNSVK